MLISRWGIKARAAEGQNQSSLDILQTNNLYCSEISLFPVFPAEFQFLDLAILPKFHFADLVILRRRTLDFGEYQTLLFNMYVIGLHLQLHCRA